MTTIRSEPVADRRREGDPPVPSSPSPGHPHESPLEEWLEARMFSRRVVRVQGRLDDLVATAAATHLMTLGGAGDDAIQLHLNSGEGTVRAALTLMDTIDALGVPVDAVCIGRAEGPALGVLAVAHHRQAASHARLRLHDEGMTAAGTGTSVAQALEQHKQQAEQFIERVAAATRQPAERVEIDLAAGRYFDVEEVLQYQLIDGIWIGGGRGAD